MGSVIDYIECPNCKNEETYSEFWYKSGEENTFCSKCGFTQSAFIKNRDKNLNELTDEDWEYKEIKNPFGAFKISGDNPGWICGTLETEKDFEDLKEQINTKNIKSFILSRFIDGEIKETDIKTG